MAPAGRGRRLLGNAIWMHLRPVSRSQPTVAWAVRLMYLCAALRLLGAPILPAAPGSSAHPLGFGISWGVFAGLAWASSRGHNWARILFAVWVGCHTLALFYDVAHVSVSSAPTWTVIASVVFWLVEASAAVLILSKPSGPFYRHEAART